MNGTENPASELIDERIAGLADWRGARSISVKARRSMRKRSRR
jgi:hypothetical protein